jgi:hypothetical protein
MPYKTFTLTFAVLDDKSIKFLKKEESELESDLPSDAIEVYNADGKQQDGITAVINKYFKAEAKDTAVETVNAVNEEPENNSHIEMESVDNTDNVAANEVANLPVSEKANADSITETTDMATGEDNKPNRGGFRRAYPKNVSFSKKYPKNKSNKKTLRHLQRIASR